MNSKKQPSFAVLPNLGPKSQEVLASIGITSVEQLRDSGSIEVYVKAKRSGVNVSLNLLWALEVAFKGLHWQEVARHYRSALLLALEQFELEECNKVTFQPK